MAHFRGWWPQSFIGAAATTLIAAMAMTTLACQSAPESGGPEAEGSASFAFRNIDHVEIAVADPVASRDFYAAHFGGDALFNEAVGRRYVKLGDSYFAFEPVEDGTEPQVDHFSIGIDDYDIDQLHAYLDEHGIAYSDFPSGRDLNITDPDGIRVQLSAADGWNALAPPNFTSDPIPSEFESTPSPNGISVVALFVSDLEASRDFYQQFLGPPATEPFPDEEGGTVTFAVGSSWISLAKVPTVPESDEPVLEPGVTLISLSLPVSERETLQAVFPRPDIPDGRAITGLGMEGDGLPDNVGVTVNIIPGTGK